MQELKTKLLKEIVNILLRAVENKLSLFSSDSMHLTL